MIIGRINAHTHSPVPVNNRPFQFQGWLTLLAVQDDYWVRRLSRFFAVFKGIDITGHDANKNNLLQMCMGLLVVATRIHRQKLVDHIKNYYGCGYVTGYFRGYKPYFVEISRTDEVWSVDFCC